MSKIRTFVRKADRSKREAIRELFRAFPKADLVDFKVRKPTAVERKKANVGPNDLVYVARLKMAQPLNTKPELADTKTPPVKPVPKSPAKPARPTPPKPDFAGKGLDDTEEIVHLLKQILDELKNLSGTKGIDKDLDVDEDFDVDDFTPDDLDEDGDVPPPPPTRDKVKGPALTYVIKRNVHNNKPADIVRAASKRFPNHDVNNVKLGGYINLDGKRINLKKAGWALIALRPKR